MSSTSTPRRVSSFISRLIRACSSARSSSSVGAATSTKLGTPSPPQRYTPAVKVNVEVRRRAEALDQRGGAAAALLCLQASAIQQLSHHHALHHLQHQRDQPRLRSQQQPQRDRQRQRPLPYRHVRDDGRCAYSCSAYLGSARKDAAES